MKKLLLSLLLSFVLGTVFGTVNEPNIQLKSKKKKEILIKGTAGVPVFRSLINSPISVCLIDNVLIIDFLESIGNVSVRVFDLKTKETIFLDTYDTLSFTFVSTVINDIGNYRIIFSSEEYEGWGQFSLDSE